MDEAMRIERTGITKKRKETGDNSTNSTLLGASLPPLPLQSTRTMVENNTHETKETNQRQKDLNVHRSGLVLNARIIKNDNSKIIKLIQANTKNTITPQIRNNLFNTIVHTIE